MYKFHTCSLYIIMLADRMAQVPASSTKLRLLYRQLQAFLGSWLYRRATFSKDQAKSCTGSTPPYDPSSPSSFSLSFNQNNLSLQTQVVSIIFTQRDSVHSSNVPFSQQNLCTFNSTTYMQLLHIDSCYLKKECHQQYTW